MHLFYDCSEYPTAEHFPCSFMTCTYLVKQKWRTYSVDQRIIHCKDVFVRGRTQLHMQMCPGGHTCIMQQRPGGHHCICKTVRRTLLHNAIMFSGLYRIEDIIACDTGRRIQKRALSEDVSTPFAIPFVGRGHNQNLLSNILLFE